MTAEGRYCRLPGGAVEAFSATCRGSVFTRHYHETHAICLIESGIGSFWCNGRMVEAREGSLVVIPAGDVHTGGSAGRDILLRYSMLYIPTALFASFHPRGRETPLSDGTGTRFTIDDPAAGSVVRRLCEASIHSEDSLTVDSLIGSLIECLAERSISGSARRERPGESRACLAVRDYIDAHYAQSIRLHTLAELVGLSPNYLVRAFREATGLPPHAYLVQRRVRAAAALLLEGVDTSEVAVRVGFYDQSQLTTHFRRRVGVTPALFRASMRTGKESPRRMRRSTEL